MHVMARVKSVAPGNLVQAVASVQLESGEELTNESESTTVTGAGT